jgi:hypothetical protein
MLRNTSFKIPSAICAGALLAVVALSFNTQSLMAAPERHRRQAPIVHHTHHLYATYRGPSFVAPTPLPRAPEYGFLRYVPANAIRGPGYTFVPGAGILGESCDLPTSACSNEYRDVE